MAGELVKANILKAFALHSADPNIRDAALKASRTAQLTGDALVQARNDTNSVLQFLLGLPADKPAPSAASIGEVLDLDKKRVQNGLDSLTRDGRLLSDGTLDPRVRANQSGAKRALPKRKTAIPDHDDNPRRPGSQAHNDLLAVKALVDALPQGQAPKASDLATLLGIPVARVQAALDQIAADQANVPVVPSKAVRVHTLRDGRKVPVEKMVRMDGLHGQDLINATVAVQNGQAILDDGIVMFISK